MALRAASSAFSSGGMVACARASAPQPGAAEARVPGPCSTAVRRWSEVAAGSAPASVPLPAAPAGRESGYRCPQSGRPPRAARQWRRLPMPGTRPGGLPGPAQAAEEIKLPTGPEVGLLGAAVAIEPRHGVEHPAQRSLDRLIAPGRLRRDLGRRQQRSCRRVQPGACLKHAASGLGNIQVLLQCRRDEARHLRIAKGCPPGCKVRGESGEGGLPSPRTRPPCRPGAGRGGRLVVRAYRTPCTKAGEHQKDGGGKTRHVQQSEA